MGYKILVADDSQTIQKVINLASKDQDFTLVSCLDEKELFDNLNKNTDLVLLDFALSDDMNGYELCKKIKSAEPSVPVLAMLGVFDSIDEQEFASSGFSEKIVKPFETEKFISLCIALLNNETVEMQSDDSDEHDSWSVSDEIDEVDEQEDVTATHNYEALSEQSDSNDLNQELSGWGFDPNELVKKDVTQHYDEFPPVIEDEVQDKEDDQDEVEDEELSLAQVNLDEEDLDYIDKTQEMTLPDLSDDNDPEDSTGEYQISDLKLEKDVSLPSEEKVDLPSEEEFEDLKSELADELEDELGDNDLWAVDENIDHEEEPTKEIEVEDVTNISNVGANTEQEHAINTELSSLPEDLKDALKADLEPLVEKYVKEFCKEEVEKLIWEIVPDLAENVIKKELSQIRETVVSSMKN